MIKAQKRFLGSILDEPETFGRKCVQLKGIENSFIDCMNDKFKDGFSSISIVDSDSYSNENLISVLIDGQKFTLLLLDSRILYNSTLPSGRQSASNSSVRSRGFSVSESVVKSLKRVEAERFRMFPTIYAHGIISLYHDSGFSVNDFVILNYLLNRKPPSELLLSRDRKDNIDGFALWARAFGKLRELHSAGFVLFNSLLDNIYLNESEQFVWINCTALTKIPPQMDLAVMNFLKLVDINRLLFKNRYFESWKMINSTFLTEIKGKFQGQLNQMVANAILPNREMFYRNKQINSLQKLSEFLTDLEFENTSRLVALFKEINIDSVLSILSNHAELEKIIELFNSSLISVSDDESDEDFTIDKNLISLEIDAAQIYFEGPSGDVEGPLLLEMDGGKYGLFYGSVNMTSKFARPKRMLAKEGQFKFMTSGELVWFAFDYEKQEFKFFKDGHLDFPSEFLTITDIILRKHGGIRHIDDDTRMVLKIKGREVYIYAENYPTVLHREGPLLFSSKTQKLFVKRGSLFEDNVKDVTYRLSAKMHLLLTQDGHFKFEDNGKDVYFMFIEHDGICLFESDNSESGIYGNFKERRETAFTFDRFSRYTGVTWVKDDLSLVDPVRGTMRSGEYFPQRPDAPEQFRNINVDRHMPRGARSEGTTVQPPTQNVPQYHGTPQHQVTSYHLLVYNNPNSPLHGHNIMKLISSGYNSSYVGSQLYFDREGIYVQLTNGYFQKLKEDFLHDICFQSPYGGLVIDESKNKLSSHAMYLFFYNRYGHYNGESLVIQ